MTAPESEPTRRSPWIRIGFSLFALGMVFLVVTVIPFFWGTHNRPVWMNVGCMLAPLGFVIAVVSAVRAGRAEQRSAARELG